MCRKRKKINVVLLRGFIKVKCKRCDWMKVVVTSLDDKSPFEHCGLKADYAGFVPPDCLAVWDERKGRK